MANGILKFMISHLGLGSNVQHDLVDFKVCDWPPETSFAISQLSGIFNEFGPLVSWMSGFQFSLIQKQIHSTRKYEVATLLSPSEASTCGVFIDLRCILLHF